MKCPYHNRCNKYLEFQLALDAKDLKIEELSRKVAALTAEIERLKNEQCGDSEKQNPAAVLPFGSSTPSSQILLKKNSPEEMRKRVGGREAGHEGSGRKSVKPENADETVVVKALEECPECHCKLVGGQIRSRTVICTIPAKTSTKVYLIRRAWCPQCRKYHEAKVPGVLPRHTFSNELIAQAITDNLGHNIPLSTVAKRIGANKSALHQMMHSIAGLLKPGIDHLLEEYRNAKVKHADETKWSCDGKHGYAWGFFTPTVSIFRFRESRAAKVAQEVFGDAPHKGVLGVDRYGAYNKSWHGKMQYCFEHYKRNVLDLLENEPDNEEYKKHIPGFVALLREAMKLRNDCKGEEYKTKSRAIRDQLLAIAETKVESGKLRALFETMVKKRHRFFQWVDHPEVEAENNMAERGLRPLTIARKISYGSQSEKGLETRETLMTIVRTLMLRTKDAAAKLASVLDAIAMSPEADVAKLLWC